MAIVVLRLDADEVDALAACVARSLAEAIPGEQADLASLLHRLRTRQANSKHSINPPT